MIPTDLAAFVSTFGTMVPWVLVLACFLAEQVSTKVWLLAFALFLSYPADIVGSHLALAQQPNQWVPAVLAPLQFGIMLWTLTDPGAHLRWIGSGLLLGLLVAVLWVELPLVVLLGIGGLLVSWVVRPYKCRRAIWLYCLGVLPGLIFLDVVAPYDPRWLWVWAATQGVRWAAIGWLAWEVSRGARYRQIGVADSRSGRPYRAARLPGVLTAHLEAKHRG